MLEITRRTTIFAAAAALVVPALAQAPTATAEPRGVDQGDNTEIKTFTYASKDNQDLELDLIIDRSTIVEKRPVIIYLFGGGWEGGERRDGSTVDLFRSYLSLGVAVVPIDYRLGVKEAKSRGESPTTETYLEAIQLSVEDLFDATSYLLEHAEEWGLDPERIVLMGGSSGATNSLVAEFNLANSTQLARARLPDGFRYAGVIAMAGAFWLKAGTPLTFASKPAPIMFFSGAKDQVVTYDEVQGPFSGYGAQYYFREFAGPDYPKWFVDYPEGDHALAALPALNNQLEIRAFLEKLAWARQELSIHTIELSKIPSSFEGLFSQQRLPASS